MVNIGVRWWWWVAALGVWAATVDAVAGTGTIDMERCRNGCSAVPEDMWPYCCESHRTCCTEFANSCVHDCLPRVHTGDVSVVEERPGLCCALYNLCCFRETLRISSSRNKKEESVDFPIFHRFHVDPLHGQGSPITMSGLITRSQTTRRQDASQLQQESRNNPRSFRGNERPRPEKRIETTPQLPKKSSRPRLPQRPQFLKKSVTGSDDRNQPAEAKLLSSLDSRDSQTDVTRIEAEEVVRLQETRKTTEDQDKREGGLLGQKKPKSGPGLTSLLGGRKEPTTSIQSGAQEVNREISDPTGETERTASAPVTQDRTGKRKSTIREPSTTGLSQQRNGRRQSNTSPRPKVTRKRLRGSTETNEKEVARQNTRQPRIQQERRGRPEGATKQSANRPLPERQSSADRRPQIIEEQTIDQIQADEEKLSPPELVAAGQSDQPQVAASRTGGRSLVADETFINEPQTPVEKVTGHLHVAVEKAIDESRVSMKKGDNVPQVDVEKTSDQTQVAPEMDVDQATASSQLVVAEITEQPLEQVTDQSEILAKEMTDLFEMAMKEDTEQSEVATEIKNEPQPTGPKSSSSTGGRSETRAQSQTMERASSRGGAQATRDRSSSGRSQTRGSSSTSGGSPGRQGSRRTNRFEARERSSSRTRSQATRERDSSQTGRGRSRATGRSQSSRSSTRNREASARS